MEKKVPPPAAVPMPASSELSPQLQAEWAAQCFGVTPPGLIWQDPLRASEMILERLARERRYGDPPQPTKKPQ